MKKAISLILILSLLSLCGCGQAETTAPEATGETAAPAEAPVAETTAAVTEEVTVTGNRILRNCSNSPFNAFGTRYAPSEITAIQFLDSSETIAGISGNDVSRDNDHSVFACVVEEGEEKILYLYGNGGIKAPEDCSRMFAEYTNLKSIDFGSCFDTSNVTNMASMFANCETLEALDLSCFDTTAVQDMSHMFSGCVSLKEVNVSSFDTKNVLFMNFMFYWADQITNVEMPMLDTSRVVDFEEFMAAGGTVNGQPWKSLFSTADASSPLYGDLFFTQGPKELVDSLVSRLATEFDIFYELTYIKASQKGTSYILVPTGENAYDVPELEIQAVPVEGGEDIQVISVTSRQNTDRSESSLSFSMVFEIYFALMGRSRQDMIDNPPSLTQVAASPTLIMEAKENGLLCDIAVFTDAVVVYYVPEGSILE